MIRLTMTVIALAASGVALAKLPPPDEATKAKAAEAASKTAWQAKVDAYKLCKVQDAVAARYKSNHPAMQATAATTAPAPAPAAAGGAAPAPAPAPAQASVVPPPTPPAKPPAPKPAGGSAAGGASVAATSPTSASASQGGSTPAAAVAAPDAVTVPPCTDPGPFAYAPADQKPLETSEAHSPAANATSPPSVRPESATMSDGKTGTTTPKK